MVQKNTLLFVLFLSIAPIGTCLHAQEAAAIKPTQKATIPASRMAFLYKRRAALLVRLQVINVLVKKAKSLAKRLAFMGQRKRLTALAQKLNKLIAQAELVSV